MLPQLQYYFFQKQAWFSVPVQASFFDQFSKNDCLQTFDFEPLLLFCLPTEHCKKTLSEMSRCAISLHCILAHISSLLKLKKNIKKPAHVSSEYRSFHDIHITEAGFLSVYNLVKSIKIIRMFLCNNFRTKSRSLIFKDLPFLYCS